MQIEIKPKGTVEYRGESRNGRILTIRNRAKGLWFVPIKLSAMTC